MSSAATWTCAAGRQSLPEPTDCNWPVCGCDPYASKVIEALEECIPGRIGLSNARSVWDEPCDATLMAMVSAMFDCGLDGPDGIGMSDARKVWEAARDSDGSPEGRDAQRFDGEAATARAGTASPKGQPS